MANELEIFGAASKALAAAVAADEEQHGGATKLLPGSKTEVTEGVRGAHPPQPARLDGSRQAIEDDR